MHPSSSSVIVAPGTIPAMNCRILPQTTNTGTNRVTMVGGKTDVPDTAEVKPPKKKFTRAFSHKVRTGCLTCKIRRKKCDEEKPFCRRCRTEDVKCDGYAPVTKTSSTKKATSTRAEAKPAHARQSDGAVVRSTPQPVLRPVYALSETLPESDWDRYLFYHFRTWTCGPLTESPGTSRFWDSYVLPLAHQDDLVRKAVIAVGAAHQLFVTKHTQCSSAHTYELERVTTRQYNAAITAVLERIKFGSPVGTHVVLLSCLLFVCFESMMGRYGEVLRHFKAGLQMLKDPNALASARDKAAVKHVIEIFGQLSCEISIFMEEHLTTDDHHRLTLLEGFGEEEGRPFTSLYHASLSLKAVDMEFHAMPCDEEGEECMNPEFSKNFFSWSHRFELMLANMNLSTLSSKEKHQIQCFKLQQRLWFILAESDCELDTMGTPEDWSEYLDLAEEVAKPYISSDKPTFSLDGYLVSGLSLMISVCTDPGIRRRGVSLLRSLNRREGVWDSKEIAEMHQATLTLHDCDSWYNMPLPGGGIPAYTQLLSVVSTGISPGNSLLSVPSSAMVAAPPDGKASSSRSDGSCSSGSPPVSLPIR